MAHTWDVNLANSWADLLGSMRVELKAGALFLWRADLRDGLLGTLLVAAKAGPTAAMTDGHLAWQMVGSWVACWAVCWADKSVASTVAAKDNLTAAHWAGLLADSASMMVENSVDELAPRLVVLTAGRMVVSTVVLWAVYWVVQLRAERWDSALSRSEPCGSSCP